MRFLKIPNILYLLRFMSCLKKVSSITKEYLFPAILLPLFMLPNIVYAACEADGTN
jgi:hypothetical protein